MLSPLLWVAALSWARPPSPLPVAMPEWLPKLLVVVDRAMATVESGRRLEAGASDVPVEARELPSAGPPIVFELGERPVIAVDPRRAKKMTLFEFELALARERARAALDAGIRLIESEQAAEQAVLEYALDRHEASDEFRRAMAKALRRARTRARVERDDAELSGGAVTFRYLPLPPSDPELAVELLARFADDPHEFYWAVERELLRVPDAVRLSDLESFLWAYSERLERAACAPTARYCVLDGRLFKPALITAARAALAGGGLDRVRESLAAFQGEAALKLRDRARAWLKKA